VIPDPLVILAGVALIFGADIATGGTLARHSTRYMLRGKL
jgi:hypothetical protein